MNMKTNSVIGNLAFAAAVAAALAGCESIKPEGIGIEGIGLTFDGNRELKEPERAGEFATFVFPELRRIEEVPVQITFSSPVENVVMTKRMLWGTSEKVATVPIAAIVKDQFLHAVAEHFHPMKGDEQPSVRMVVDILGIVMTRMESRVKSQITVRIVMRDALKGDAVCMENIYSGTSEMEWDGGDLVPDSAYKCVQALAESFLRDLASNRTLIARLESATPDASSIRKPSFEKLDIKPRNEAGFVCGECVLACNDWDEGRAANWLRGQLERRCENQLGVDASRLRLVYDTCSYDVGRKAWSVSFSAFARTAMILNYDAVTMSGTCVADFELMGKTAEKAADALKEYVMQEMDKRSGAQQTGKESAKAMVRFDDFKTDQRYALTHCSFRVVY